MKKKVLAITLLTVTGYVSAGWFDWAKNNKNCKTEKGCNEVPARPNIARTSDAKASGFFNDMCSGNTSDQDPRMHRLKNKDCSSKTKKCQSCKKC